MVTQPTTRTKLVDIMLSEISQMEKNNHYIILFIRDSRFPQAEGMEELKSIFLNRYRVLLLQDE